MRGGPPGFNGRKVIDLLLSLVIGPVKADAQTLRISPEPSPSKIFSRVTPFNFASASISKSLCSSGYRHARLKASVIALNAFGDGPYGFSFELKRTRPLLVVGLAAGSVAGKIRGLTTAAAAPAVNNCANLRLEIEVVFISKPPPELLGRAASEGEIELL